MFSHAPPYTYHPNYLDLFHYFASPGGSLLWDILLQALGILFTVVILQRILDHREKMRWRPAQQDLYRRLFSHASWLIKGLPSDVREGWPQTAYKFGYGSIDGRVDPAFSGRVRRLKPKRLQEAVENFANDPTLLEQFEENLDATLRHSAAIFLARDPELSRVLGDFREWLTRFKRILEGYREVRQASRKSGTDPGRRATSDVSMQARVQLKELIIEAVRLQSCLARHADEIRPFGSARRS